MATTDPPLWRDAWRGFRPRVARHRNSSTGDTQRRDQDPASPGTEQRSDSSQRRRVSLTAVQQKDAGIHARNQMLVVVTLTCLLIPVTGLQALESSINDVGGVGSACLALSYGPSLLSIVFLLPLLLLRIGAQRIFQLSSIPFMAFVAAHFKVIPSVYLTVCAVFGTVNFLMDAAATVLTTSAAIDYAAIYGVDPDHVVTKFGSLLYISAISAYLIGPLASSFILHNPPEFAVAVANSTKCHLTSKKAVVAETDRLVLLGVYLGLAALANVMVWTLRPASTTTIKAKISDASAWKKITATLRLVGDFDMLLLIPMFFNGGLSKQVLHVDYTKFFVTSCLGVVSVGFVIACFASANFLTTMLLPQIMRRVSRAILVCVAACVQISVLWTLVLWEKTRNTALIYAMAVCWGLADAIWNMTYFVMLGVLFADQQEAGVSNYRGWQSLGWALGSWYSQRIGDCVRQLRIKLIYVALLQILVVACFLLVEYRLTMRRRRRAKSVRQEGDEEVPSTSMELTECTSDRGTV